MADARAYQNPELSLQALADQLEVKPFLISGSFDPVTPVKWASQLDRELANSYHVIFPGWTHTPTTYWDNPCGMRVANTFFNDPTQAPALPCFTALGVPDFE